MKELNVKYMGNVPHNVSIAEAAELLDHTTVAHPVKIVNWEEFSYSPQTDFLIAHTNNEIWLKYSVTEQSVRATETRINGEVYKDSCVEFFISFNGTNYYNIEFNCIGTVHMAYGPDRNNREFVSPETIKKIKTFSSLGTEPFGEKNEITQWDLMICLPTTCFVFDSIDSLSQIKATANFYKCGDDTSVPHFVSWSRIKTGEPDFHRPEFFGTLYFE